uniref:Uncharacterized protein MANES_18G003900 n=1 Tax=Rhizophora mucronata TaxID=61149 RepID=A0A2P2M6B0_RHIMU
MAIGLPSTRNLPSQGNPERPPRIPISLRGLQVPSSFSCNHRYLIISLKCLYIVRKYMRKKKKTEFCCKHSCVTFSWH